jgi:uncharacterized protein
MGKPPDLFWMIHRSTAFTCEVNRNCVQFMNLPAHMQRTELCRDDVGLLRKCEKCAVASVPLPGPTIAISRTVARPRPWDMTTAISPETTLLTARVDALPWPELRAELDARGFAVTPPLLAADECAELAALFDGGRFRSTIDMARHRFGDGRYRYFEHPLPPPIAELRAALYGRLAAVANDWAARLRGEAPTFPLTHDELLERCAAAGQTRPTPLILRYGPGDWNALHQDLYGDVFFPFQALTVLSEAGVDFDGGEFVLLEQRPRAQSRAHVLQPPRGAFVLFPTHHRPNAGRNGYHRVGLRHGVSTITRGSRTALGIIFHDAR